MIEDDKRAVIGRNGYLQASQLRHPACPGTGRVDQASWRQAWQAMDEAMNPAGAGPKTRPGREQERA